MKVLHVNDHFDRVGGAETILFNTLDVLDEQRVENVIVHQYPTRMDGKRWCTYQVDELGEERSQKQKEVLLRFFEIISKEKPDLIHIHDIGNPAIAQISQNYFPTLQSVYNHSYYCPSGSKYLNRLEKVCGRPFSMGCLVSAFTTRCNSIRPTILFSSYRRVYKMMKKNNKMCFLTLSHYQKQCLVDNGFPESLVKVLAPYTAIPDGSIGYSDSKSKNILLFVGRIVAQKGLGFLIRSLSILKSDYHLIVVGDGPELKNTKALTAILGIDKRVEFLGWLDKEYVSNYYQQASIVIVPSLWPEPFGMAGIEGMSYGKPVIAFNVGGVSEWLEDNVTGFLINPYDSNEMANKIEFLLRNPEVTKAMGNAGQTRIKEKFNKELYANHLLNFYQEVINMKRANNPTVPNYK